MNEQALYERLKEQGYDIEWDGAYCNWAETRLRVVRLTHETFRFTVFAPNGDEIGIAQSIDEVLVRLSSWGWARANKTAEPMAAVQAYLGEDCAFPLHRVVGLSRVSPTTQDKHNHYVRGWALPSPQVLVLLGAGDQIVVEGTVAEWAARLGWVK